MNDVSASHQVPRVALILYFVFKIVPLLIAAMSIYLGYKLFILGVTGQASLSINSKDVSGQLLNAAPGLFFAVGGILAVLVTVWKGVSLTLTEGDQNLFTANLAPSRQSPAKGSGSSGTFPSGRIWALRDKEKGL